MSAEWPEYLLQDLCDFQNGFAFKNSDYVSGSANTWEVFRMGYISRGGGFKEDSTPVFVPKEYSKKLDRYLLRKGDLTIAMTDMKNSMALLGHTARIPEDERFVLNQRVGLIRVRKTETLDPLYLYYFSNSPDYIASLRSRANSGVQVNLSTSAIKESVLKVPPLSVQKSIGETLGSLDDKIQLNHQINQTLEQMAQAIFKSWFVDFEPVKAKITALEAGGCEEDALRAAMQAISGKTREDLTRLQTEQPEQYAELRATAELFPSAMQDSELGEIPEGWKSSTVGHEFDVTMGQSPPGDTYNEEGDGAPFFQGRRDFGERFPSNRVYCSVPKRMANEGDTLLSVRAPVGDTNIALMTCCIGRGLAALRHKSGCSSYTYYLIIQLGQALSSYDSEGTVFGSINQKNLRNIPLVAPAPDALTAFKRAVGPIDDLIKVNSEEATTLSDTRDALLPKLLSGELSVSDAEDHLVKEAEPANV